MHFLLGRTPESADAGPLRVVSAHCIRMSQALSGRLPSSPNPPLLHPALTLQYPMAAMLMGLRQVRCLPIRVRLSSSTFQRSRPLGTPPKSRVWPPPRPQSLFSILLVLQVAKTSSPLLHARLVLLTVVLSPKHEAQTLFSSLLHLLVQTCIRRRV